jgi:NAD dependent epimerase/dehydratase family
LQAVIDRCGVISGPWQFGKVDQGVLAHWVLAHHFGKPLSYIGYGGTGKQVRDFLHIDDVYDLLCEQVQHFETWQGWLGNVSGDAPHGFGRAVIKGVDNSRGEAMVIMMADESDDCRDVVRYWQVLNEGWDCVFGSRFIKGGGVIDYPWLKLLINRFANFFIRALFGISLNDTTNAFKAYRKTVLDGCRPFLSPHFNLTVELPLKAIVRGYSWSVVPVTWRNRHTGDSKLRLRKWAAVTSSLLLTFG